MVAEYNLLQSREYIESEYLPPIPPIEENINNDNNNKELITILKWQGKTYHINCLSRRFNTQFLFQHPELGDVVYSEDQQTLLYSQNDLDPEIYCWMQRKIKAWVKSFSDF